MSTTTLNGSNNSVASATTTCSNTNCPNCSTVSPAVIQVTEEEMQTMINSPLNDANAKTVKSTVSKLNTSLAHYQKVLKRWQLASTAVTCIAVVLGQTSVISSLIIQFLIDYGGMDNTVATDWLNLIDCILVIAAVLINSFWFSRKIAEYNKVISDIVQCINQVYIIYQQAVANGSVTADELTQFNAIIAQNNQQITTDSVMPAISLSSISAMEPEVAAAVSNLITAVKKV